MRSIREIVNLVVDGELTTKAGSTLVAAAYIEDRAAQPEMTLEKAQAEFYRDLAHAALLWGGIRQRTIRELFELED
jgi:hypothetical protein